MRQVHPGAKRTQSDGCRRYLPRLITFDSRSHSLDPISDDWEPAIKTQATRNRELVRSAIIHEFGNNEHEQKIKDFADLGPAPWSVLDQHNEFMNQIRNAFTGGAYYPALVAAGALGERVLNELVVRLREYHAQHPATAAVATKKAISNWGDCIKALVEWAVLDENAATAFYALSKLRHAAVHYGQHLNQSDARTEALEAVRALQSIIEGLFPPLGGPPRFIAGTTGHSFISTEAEHTAFVQEFVLPSCVLVSPTFEMRYVDNGWFDVFDDDTYHDRYPTLTDAEFADHRNNPGR